MTRIAAGLAALLLAGCASVPFTGEEEQDDSRVPFVCAPDAERLPCVAGVERSVPYRFNLLTHCGIEWAYFDGRYWVPRPRVAPPPDWAAIEGGTMVLRSPTEAVFEAAEGGGARFVPASSSFRPEACA